MESNEYTITGSNGCKINVEYNYEYQESEPDVGFIGGYYVNVTGAYSNLVSQFIDNDGDVEIIVDIPLEQLDIEAIEDEIRTHLNR